MIAICTSSSTAVRSSSSRVRVILSRSTGTISRRGRPFTKTTKRKPNRAYEEKFGFRFVVFVNSRPRREIVPVLRERIERTREEELATGVDELVQIAVDRWRTS